MDFKVLDLNIILDEAEDLSGMGIKTKEVSREGDRAVYIAEITPRPAGQGYVTPHYHPDLKGGIEWYQIIETGEDAFMCIGLPELAEEKDIEIKWNKPYPIKAGNFFIVPNGMVHSLVSGKSRLRFMFGCPDAHLDNNRDKIVIAGARPPIY